MLLLAREVPQRTPATRAIPLRLPGLELLDQGKEVEIGNLLPVQ